MTDVMHFPRVQPIFWGDYYQSDPKLIPLIEQTLSDLISGPFINGLAQYGIKRGFVLKPIIIDVTTNPAPASIWDFDLAKKLLSWFPNQVPAPAVDEINRLYPTETTLLKNNGPSDPIGNGIQGWHDHTKYNASSVNDDVIWTTVKTNDRTRASALDFAKDLAQYLAHELVEAFNDPLLDGRQELGYPCENSGTFNYKGIWPVQMYWSNWDNRCIHGDQPPALPLSFQAMVPSTQIFVLGSDGNLWLERAPFGTVPPSRQQVDANVLTLQARDIQNVLVLGSDGNLWLEHAPFGNVPPRPEHVDGAVQAFQGIDSEAVLVLGTDGNLWLEHAPFGNVPPKREKVDATVA